MELRFVELIVWILATSEVVEIYHHGSNMASLRAYLQSLDNWLGDLFSCMFCFSVWIAWIVVAIALVSRQLVAPYADAMLWFVCGLAVARGANLLNDLSHRWCRTPRPEPGPDD